MNNFRRESGAEPWSILDHFGQEQFATPLLWTGDAHAKRQNPPEGSREIVERDLRRQQQKNKKRQDADTEETKASPAQADVIRRAELALDVKAKVE